MNNDRPLFILAGNGPYENRGCEAIVRGTVKILREYFQDPEFICLSFFQNTEQYRKQSENEFDSSITHIKTNRGKSFFYPEWWYDKIIQRISPGKIKYKTYSELLQHLNDSHAVLSVGGDNYSLDYGIPQLFTDLDDIVIERKLPLVIWGASVGPFDKNPSYQKFMSYHLQKITGIFARESVTIDYLKRIGIEKNVFAVADPAFLLDPQKPITSNLDLGINADAIGINLSPLMARYVTNGDPKTWIKKSAEIVSTIAKNTERQICLIPHVTSPHDNDFVFLEKVVKNFNKPIPDLVLIPPTYNAAETKWIIGQMRFFVGARTHATIAALSMEIPTLSLGYSIKAEGINRDLFGHTNYCIRSHEFNPGIFAKKVSEMAETDNSIRNEIRSRLPGIRVNAMNAGKYLNEICG